MKLRSFSISQILRYSSLGTFIALAILVTITVYQINRISHQQAILTALGTINESELQLRKSESDFILREAINPNLYKTGKSTIISNFDSLSKLIKNRLLFLKENISEQERFQVDSLSQMLVYYQNTFSLLTQKVMERGFKDFGIEGELRKKIHDVEAMVNANSDLQMKIDMLMLRRHEKDFIIRKDLQYVQQFKDALNEAIAYSNRRYGKQSEITQLLVGYGNLFSVLVGKYQEIGLTEDSGLLANLRKTTASVETNLEQLRNSVTENAQKAKSNAIKLLIMAVLLISVIITLVFFKISQHIGGSLIKLKAYISSLGMGELPQPIQVEGKDELAEMEFSINSLTEALRNTRDFAIEVGNGNFTAEIKVFNNSGELGLSLLEMRKKLEQIAIEREHQEEENNNRLWLNEGLTAFAAMLRGSHASVDELCFEATRMVVRHIKANQGGLFLLEEPIETQDEPFFSLKATYAFERRKYIKKTLDLHEGLIGMCFFEKETIFLTDIPADYTKITSGLGDATPRCLVILPIKNNEEIIGVLEVASFADLQPHQISYTEKALESLAAAILTTRITHKTQQLLAQSRQQAEELAASEEELRQNMEELTATREQMEEREQGLIRAMEEHKIDLENRSEEYKKQISSLEQELEKTKQKLGDMSQDILYAEFNMQGEPLEYNSSFGEIFEHISKPFVQLLFEGSKEHAFMCWEEITQGKPYEGILAVSHEHESSLRTCYYCNVTKQNSKSTILLTGIPTHNNINRQKGLEPASPCSSLN